MTDRELKREKKRAEEAYQQVLEACVDMIYHRAKENGRTWIDLAGDAHISVGTVYRLGNRETQFPHFRTVMLLARAVGMEVVIQQAIKNARRRAA